MTFNTRDYFVLTRYHRFSSLVKVKGAKNYKPFYIFFWGLLGGGLVIFLLLPWQQSVSGEGRVIAFSPNERRQQISAPIDGRVKTWFVEEGAHVKKGQVLAELEDNDPNILDRFDLEKDAALKKLNAAEAALVTAKKNIDRQEDLVKKD